MIKILKYMTVFAGGFTFGAYATIIAFAYGIKNGKVQEIVADYEEKQKQDD